MPQISIIVPVYKVEPYIRRCVDSILAQTFTDFELILVDDGSPDNCGAICDEYAAVDSRIHVIHQENQGQAAARNHALDWVFAHSDSEYISFIDSDDWVHPRYLELLLQGIQRYGVNICQCKYVRIENEESQPELETTFFVVSPEKQYVDYYSPYLWDKLFARAIWEKMRFPEGQIFEDLAILYKIIFREEQIALVHSVLYYYFINQNSTVLSAWSPKRMARLEAWDEQIHFFERLGNREVLKDAVRRACEVDKHEYYAIQRSDAITADEKIKYQNLVEIRVRKLLQDHKDIIKSLSDYEWCWETAHPILTRNISRFNRLKKVITKQ